MPIVNEHYTGDAQDKVDYNKSWDLAKKATIRVVMRQEMMNDEEPLDRFLKDHYPL